MSERNAPDERKAPYCSQCGAPTELVNRFGRLRPICTVCHRTVFFDPKVAVTALVIRDHDGAQEVLLVKRSNDPAKGLWALPAGFVEPDEDPRHAAIREVEEETGVRITTHKLIDVLHRPDPDGLADLVIAFAGEPLGGDVLAGDDAEDAGWFRQDALPDVALATTIKLIGLWVSGAL